ncbi:MAG: serine/threonine-protein kinase [Thermoanaerobaculia bacterium]|nr:serine/threonine-protein kinase [Thermoanaerobaculia bacterium]
MSAAVALTSLRLALVTGTQLGHFEVAGPIGSGGMGEVYRARDRKIGRDVALKILPGHLVADREKLTRFAQEARTAGSLNHPNIVTIFDIGLANGLPFIAMELVEGQTLRNAMNSGPLSLRRFLEIASQMAEGAARAHEAGLVHRDLKPENIMITKDGFVKILDFGLAKLQSGTGAANTPPEGGLTQTGIVVGTPGYMSPEQAAGRALDARSDQFSLGLIFYEMATGKRAFHKATAVQTMSAILSDEPEPIQKLNPKIPSPLRWLIERCLSKEQDDRYSSTRDLARELRQLLRNIDSLSGFASVAELPRVSDTRSLPVSSESAATVATPASPMAATEPTKLSAVRVPQPKKETTSPLRVGATVLGALFLLSLAGYAGYWIRGAGEGTAQKLWKGELVLGGTFQALAPRISPDGKRVAFITIAGGNKQIAVMDPASGDWNVLTKQARKGSIVKVDWSADGTKIIFDRVTDVPAGVFSIPAIGGDERLVLEEASNPEALDDGTLLVTKLDKDRNLQMFRVRPDGGPPQSVGPPIVPESMRAVIRALPSSQQVLVWGRVASAKDASGRQLLKIDIRTGKAEPFLSSLPLSPPFTPSHDGAWLYSKLSMGDLHQIVAVSRDGSVVQPLFSLTSQPWALSASPDGSLLVALRESPGELLRFPVTGGLPERLCTVPARLMTAPVELPGGGLIVPGFLRGIRRLFVLNRDGILKPFISSTEQTSAPVALLNSTTAICMTGGERSPPALAQIALDSGRVLKTMPVPSGTLPRTLAAAPDGRLVVLADAGNVYALDLTNGTSRRICAGHSATLEPNSGQLIVQRHDPDGVRLFRVAPGGGPEKPVHVTGEARMAPGTLASQAFSSVGQMAMIADANMGGNWSPALLDLVTGALEVVPVRYEGDIVAVSYASDGHLLAMGTTQRSELWRFSPVTQH